MNDGAPGYYITERRVFHKAELDIRALDSRAYNDLSGLLNYHYEHDSASSDGDVCIRLVSGDSGGKDSFGRYSTEIAAHNGSIICKRLYSDADNPDVVNRITITQYEVETRKTIVVESRLEGGELFYDDVPREFVVGGYGYYPEKDDHIVTGVLDDVEAQLTHTRMYREALVEGF